MIETDQKQFAEYREIIECELEQALHGSDKISELMRVSALGGGSDRIHGVLVLEFCRVFGGDIDKAVCVAAAFEMIQAGCCEAAPLFVRDSLLAGAFNTACFSAFVPKGLKARNAMSVISTVSIISNAVVEMNRGRQLEIEFEKSKKISEDDLLGMYNRRVCAMISAACVCGVICADSGSAKQPRDRDLHMARGYGVAFGLAMQFYEDLRSLPGRTCVALFGEEKTKEKAREYVDTAVKIVGKMAKSEFLQGLAINLKQERFKT